jgi:hypothetical protein
MSSCNNKTFDYTKLFDKDFLLTWNLLINESSNSSQTS